MQSGKDLVEKFLDKLSEGKETGIIELFSKEATLLPFLSKDQYVGRDSIAKYFRETFLPQNPEGELVSEYTQKIGNNLIVVGGDWNFRIKGQEEPVVHARYTMVFRKKSLILGGWEIVQMHSSILP
jgi:hypothetical protein